MYVILLLVTNADEDLFLLLKGGIKKSRPKAACAALGRHLSHAPETLASILTRKTNRGGGRTQYLVLLIWGGDREGKNKVHYKNSDESYKNTHV